MKFFELLFGYVIVTLLVWGSLWGFIYVADFVGYTNSLFELEDLMYIYFAFSIPVTTLSLISILTFD